MPTATWKGVLLAQSDDTVVVEGNHYFPLDALDRTWFRPSEHTTWCSWKGEASYFHLHVDGHDNPNAAWFYADPKPKAEQIRGRVAFWKGVVVG